LRSIVLLFASVIALLPAAHAAGQEFNGRWDLTVYKTPAMILGGWELNAINTANTGLPVDVDYKSVGSQ